MTILDMNALKVKTAPASFVALMTAAQDHGGKEGYTFEWPKLTPTLGSSFLQPLLCSTLFIGLVTCTYKYQIFDSLEDGRTGTLKHLSQ